MEKLTPAAIEYLQNYSLRILVAIAIFFAGLWLARRLANLARKLMERAEIDITLTKFVRNIVYYTLLLVVVMATLDELGVNTTSFLAVMGAAGLAVGLALKDSLSNFASGVMLILFRPFGVGDVVEAGGVTGTVEEITVFNTILKTPDNQTIIVPNSTIASNVIVNVTAQETRRVDLVFGIGYDDDIGEAKRIIGEIIQADERILDDPAPTIAVADLADSSVNINVRPWVKTGDYWKVRADLLEKVKLAFDEAGISIPYPQREVHLVSEAKSA